MDKTGALESVAIFLYPFRISDPVVAKLGFVHRVLTDLPGTRISRTGR